MTRERQPIRAIDPICAECGKMATHKFGVEVFPTRPKMHDIPIFHCECGAWVFCHRGTDIPEGFPAGQALRDLRQRAQHAIDRLWNAKVRMQGTAKGKAKAACYTWLGEALGIAPDDMHVPHLSKADVWRVIRLVEPIAQAVGDKEMAINRAKREAAQGRTP